MTIKIKEGATGYKERPEPGTLKPGTLKIEERHMLFGEIIFTCSLLILISYVIFLYRQDHITVTNTSVVLGLTLFTFTQAASFKLNSFYFSGGEGLLRWKQVRFIHSSTGVVRFGDITGAVIECEKGKYEKEESEKKEDKETTGGGYRIVVETTLGALPLTESYRERRSEAEAGVRRIKEILSSAGSSAECRTDG